LTKNYVWGLALISFLVGLAVTAFVAVVVPWLDLPGSDLAENSQLGANVGMVVCLGLFGVLYLRHRNDTR
jgi:hypothetical protein